MTRPGSAVRLLLSSLLLGSSFPAAAEPQASAPAADGAKAAPLKPADQIKRACEAEAVEVRLLDDAAPSAEGEPAPGPSPKRGKEAQRVANRLGAGVESESDGAGQTLTRKRGKTSKAKCRADLRRLQGEFSDRISFGPTTAARVELLRASRDALISEGLRKKPEDAVAAAALFDGGPGGGLIGAAPDGVAAGAPSAGPRPSAYAPGVQLPASSRGPVSFPVPPAQNYSAPVFAETFTRGVSSAYEATTAYVSSSLDEAGKWVSGVARSVRNRFYSGIEMIQGFGYKFIHAGRRTNWGTKPLIEGLRKIAAYMRGTGKAETDLAVGDISSVNGGQLGGHASHQTGRDVDIGFYMTDAGSGKAVDTVSFVRFASGRDGLTGYNGGRAVRFDAERNWLLIQAILANPDPEFKPTHIFIAKHLEGAVLAAAGGSPDRARAAALMSYWPGHDNHLHLRVQ